MLGVREEPRERATFTVPAALMKVLRGVSEETGVPMSRMVTNGLERELGRYQIHRAGSLVLDKGKVLG